MRQSRFGVRVWVNTSVSICVSYIKHTYRQTDRQTCYRLMHQSFQAAAGILTVFNYLTYWSFQKAAGLLNVVKLLHQATHYHTRCMTSVQDFGLQCHIPWMTQPEETWYKQAVWPKSCLAVGPDSDSLTKTGNPRPHTYKTRWTDPGPKPHGQKQITQNPSE